MYKSIDRFVSNIHNPSQMFVNYKDLVTDDYHRQSHNIWWKKYRRNYRLNHFRRLYGYPGEADHWIYVQSLDTRMSNRFAYLSFENDGILVVNVRRYNSGGATVDYYFTGQCEFIPANEITSVNYKNATLGKKYTLTFNGQTKKFKIRRGHFADTKHTSTYGDTLTEGLVEWIHHYTSHQYPADTYQKRKKIQKQATKKCVIQQVISDCVSHPKNPLDSWKHFWTFRVCNVDSRTGLLWDLIMTLILSSVVIKALFLSLGWNGWTAVLTGILYYLLCLEVVRRLHDVGWHWIVIIAMLIPGVNLILLLILLFKPSVHTSGDEVRQIIATMNKK